MEEETQCPWHTKPLWVSLIPKQSPACWVLLLKRNISSFDTDLDKSCVFGKKGEKDKQKTSFSALSACLISAGWSSQPDPISGEGTLETTGWQSMVSLESGEMQEQDVPFLRKRNMKKALFFFLSFSFNVTTIKFILLIDQAIHLPIKHKWQFLNYCQIWWLCLIRVLKFLLAIWLLSPTRLHALARLK